MTRTESGHVLVWDKGCSLRNRRLSNRSYTRKSPRAFGAKLMVLVALTTLPRGKRSLDALFVARCAHFFRP